MQGACEKNLFFRFPGAVKCCDIFVFNSLTHSSFEQIPLRAGLVPVVNRIYRYASFADMSYLCKGMNPSVQSMRAFEPGIANRKPSMRNGTSA